MAIIDRTPKWSERFTKIIEECWEHHGPPARLLFKTAYDTENEVWLWMVAPVFQEVLGGEDDGKKVWTGFIFHTDHFMKYQGVYVESFAASSYCVECSPTPMIMFRGKYRGHGLYLQILLEPPRDTQIVEIIDTINNKIIVREPTDEFHPNTSEGEDQAGNEDQEP